MNFNIQQTLWKKW